MARVSVIVPAYQPGTLLRRAVDSVLAQTVPDLECLVVDDGSTEDLSWVADHPDPRVRYLRQDNHGVSTARNVGVLHARSELIAFLDQDDEWFPDKLRRQLRALAAAPDASFCHTDFTWSRGDRHERCAPQRITYRGLLADQHVCLSSVLVPRTTYLTVGGHDPVQRLVQDYDLFLRLSRLADPVGVPEVLVHYHLHDANVSADYRTAARERDRLIRAHRDLARHRRDAETVTACDAGLARTRELFGLRALDAARAAHHADRKALTGTHLWHAAVLSHGRIVRALAPAVRTRLTGRRPPS